MDIFLKASALVCIGDFWMREVDMKTWARRIFPLGLHVVPTRSESAAHALQNNSKGFGCNPIVGIFRVVVVAIHYGAIRLDKVILAPAISCKSRAHMIVTDGCFEVVS